MCRPRMVISLQRLIEDIEGGDPHHAEGFPWPSIVRRQGFRRSFDVLHRLISPGLIAKSARAWALLSQSIAI
jgi:hypothetical protein